MLTAIPLCRKSGYQPYRRAAGSIKAGGPRRPGPADI